MVAVQNYHGNPAPPTKPALTFQTGDVIELLRGDPESQWWEVGPGRISPPAAPSSLPRAEVESAAFPGQAGLRVLHHQRENGCSQGLGVRVSALTWQGEQRPLAGETVVVRALSLQPPAWAASCTYRPRLSHPASQPAPVPASALCPALGGQHVRGPAQPSPRRHRSP